MGYKDQSDEERLKKIQEETRRKKEELERLQLEELHQIREMERKKNEVRSKSIKKVPDVDGDLYDDYDDRGHRGYDGRGEYDSPYNRSVDDVRRDSSYDERQRHRDSERSGRSERERAERKEAMRAEREAERKAEARREREAERREREEARRADREAEREEKRIRRKAGRGRKKHPVRNFFVAILVIILILGLVGGLMIHSVVSKFDTLETEVSKRPDSMTGNIVNILLVGQDAREGQGGQRSDSMIVCSINKTKRTVTLISIMRDTYVQIPGYGGNRINAAFAFGGYDLLDKTIEENFGITIDGNAEVDFEGFLEAMTAIGDLDIELTQEEADYMNTNQGLGYADDGASGVDEWHLTAGMNRLNPHQVLAYSRMRYVGHSDWDRTARQRNVISAAMSKVKHGHLIGGYRMANAAAPSIATDVKTSGMMGCALPVLLSSDTKSYIIPADGAYSAQTVNGMAVLVPDLEKNKELIQQYINGTYEEDAE